MFTVNHIKFQICAWQPLGPLLKVKLLVGYMRSGLCRVGTVNSRRQSVLEPQKKDKHE